MGNELFEKGLKIRREVLGALNNDCTKSQIMEFILQCAVHCEVPAAMESMRLARELFQEME